MNLAPSDLRQLAHHASRAAREAGELIAASRPAVVEHKPPGTAQPRKVVTDVDRRTEAAILDALAPTVQQFDLGLLSEERPDRGQRHEKPFFWCIDPLDGTLPFIEGKPGFAVSIALVSRAGVPVIGVIVDPLRGTLYRAIDGLELTRNQQPWAPVPAASNPHLSASWTAVSETAQTSNGGSPPSSKSPATCASPG